MVPKITTLAWVVLYLWELFFSAMVSFDNTEQAFAYRSDADLRKSYFLFRMIGNPGLVTLGNWATQWALKWNLPIKGVVKKTIYRQFVGGETMAEALPMAKRIAEFGVQCILDYSAEGKEEETVFDETAKIVTDSIAYAAQHKDVFPLSVFKLTGVARFALLEKVSSGAALSPTEAEEWQRVIQRVTTICQWAVDQGQPVMIDAEESWIQPAIDQLAEDMMKRYNTQQALIFTTVQMYRHDRLAYLADLLNRMKAENRFVGVKVVRGAYMEKERDRAKEKGYPSPIQPDKASTDRDYNAAISLILDHLDYTALVAGTHNEISSESLMQLMKSKGLPNDTPHVYFSQLFGMSDHISFNLAKAGYRVVKYLPFGPVHDVLPYLIRRAEENTSVAGQTSRELSLITKELRRRHQKS